MSTKFFSTFFNSAGKKMRALLLGLAKSIYIIWLEKGRVSQLMFFNTKLQL